MSAAGAQPFRLAAGGLVDRGRDLAFTFDGRRLAGHPGDTLASALVANGVKLVGRSFKYHRPRGILTAGSEEPNALVELRSGGRREPNTRATTAELYDGLDAASQNRWPSLRLDLLSVNSALAPFLTAGFYYKTFMWPSALWEKLYEPLIRRAAGLGRASGLDDPDSYEKAHAFCDVLVVGSGPAGLAAALAAGRAGARVILAEDDFRLGGRLLSERLEIDGRPGAVWAGEAEAELAALANVRLMPRSAVFGAYDGEYGALERVADHHAETPPHRPRQRLWKIVAKRTVLAAGAIERPIVFGDNDRPVVMMASAVRTYLNRFGAVPGRSIVVFTACDDGWKTAFDAAATGLAASVVEAREAFNPALESAARKAGIAVHRDARVVAVRGGVHGAAEIEVVRRDGGSLRLAADCLAVSGGYNPTLALTCHLGAKPAFDAALQAFVPGELPPGMGVAGAAGGHFSLAAALDEGAREGAAAARDCGRDGIVPRFRASDEPVTARACWRVADSHGKAFVDFQNDVTDKDVALAHREGYGAVELLKRYTTLGMATDQGKTANVNALAIMAELTGRSIPQTGTTTFRPPFTPVAIAAFAGHHRGKSFRPTRLPPSHRWAQEQGAAFVETGAWLRAQWYPQPGEADWLASVSREVRTVRSAVGFCDVSTLGKIDVQGPDAGAFLDRVYCNTFSTLPVGKARYGLMLREDGFVMDDGTTSRLAPQHYLMTTTTANAAKVMQHLEFCRQVHWPELDVQIVSVTEQWAQYSIAGPRARDLLGRLVDPAFDLSNAAFPYLAAAPMTLCGGIRGRLFRISFSGELAYELAVPARYGASLARALMQAGADLGVVPYGTEALGVMRIEKGHVAGNELNGQTTAFDLGLGRMLSSKKDFVGRTLAGRAALLEPRRLRLAGFKPVQRTQRLRGGTHFIAAGQPADAAHDAGYMTSVAFSPTLGHWIGLGLISGGPERHGERLRAVDPLRGEETEVEACDPVFLDPAGARLQG